MSLSPRVSVCSLGGGGWKWQWPHQQSQAPGYYAGAYVASKALDFNRVFPEATDATYSINIIVVSQVHNIIGTIALINKVTYFSQVDLLAHFAGINFS